MRNLSATCAIGAALALVFASSALADSAKLKCSGYVREEGKYWLDLPETTFELPYFDPFDAYVLRRYVQLKPNALEPNQYEAGFESRWLLYLRRSKADGSVSVSFNSAPLEPKEGTLGCDANGGREGAECAATSVDRGVKRAIMLNCKAS